MWFSKNIYVSYNLGTYEKLFIYNLKKNLQCFAKIYIFKMHVE